MLQKFIWKSIEGALVKNDFCEYWLKIKWPNYSICNRMLTKLKP